MEDRNKCQGCNSSDSRIVAFLVIAYISSVAFVILSSIWVANNNTDVEEVKFDSTAVKTLQIELDRDSIKLDSLKRDYEDKIKVVKKLDDSTSVELFIKLVKGEV